MRAHVAGLVSLVALVALGCGSRTELASAPSSDTSGEQVPARCPGLSTTPTVLASLDPERSVGSLAIHGDHLYYGVSGGVPAPAIYRVALAGGLPELVVDQDYDGGTIALDDAYLYFSSPELGIHAFAQEGGVTLSPGDAMSGALYTHAVVTNGAPGVFWGVRSLKADGGMAIEHWDPSTRAHRTIVADADLAGFFADGTNIYFVGRDGAYRKIQSQPIAGGAVTTLAAISNVATDNIIQMIGVDAMHVVYTPSELGGDIHRVDKSGGNDTVLVKAVGFNGARFVDDAWVYWSGRPDPTMLLRTPLSGSTGAPERLYTAASTHIDAVTADDCHIVWEVAKPPQLLLRGR